MNSCIEKLTSTSCESAAAVDATVFSLLFTFAVAFAVEVVGAFFG
jgi:hypothetical protein